MRHGSSSTARALAAAGLALALSPFAASASFAGARQAEPIEVVGNQENKFVPADVTATPDADGNITVTLTSEGTAPHTWENKDLGIDSGNVDGGDSKTFTFKAPPAGKHEIICLYHESLGMVGSLTVEGGEPADPDDSPTAGPSSQPPASAAASPTVGGGEGVNAPPAGEHAEGEEGEHVIPGLEDNPVLEEIEAQRAAQQGAVSGFKFFTFVCVAFLFILGAAVLFSTKPRRPAR